MGIYGVPIQPMLQARSLQATAKVPPKQRHFHGKPSAARTDKTWLWAAFLMRTGFTHELLHIYGGQPKKEKDLKVKLLMGFMFELMPKPIYVLSTCGCGVKILEFSSKFSWMII